MAGGFAMTSGGRSSDLPPPNKLSFLLIWLTIMAVMGGFLFGYDTGIVSGALILLKNRFSLDDLWQELIVSGTVGAAAISSLFTGVINDKFGRKKVILGSSVLFIIGSVVLAVSGRKEVLLVGRLILGFAIGVSSSTIPSYVAECSPAHVRGRMLTMFQLLITFGFWCAGLLAGALTEMENKDMSWRLMLGLAAVPAGIQLVGFFFMPESPRWLATNNREQEARKIMTRVYGNDDIAEQHANFELELIRESQEETKRELDELGYGNKSPLMIMLKTPHLRKALIIGCTMQMSQQLSGINTVMYYSASIVMMSGINDPKLAIWLAAVTSGVNFFCTFIGIYLVEKIGRRKLLLISITGVFLCLLLLGLSFALIAKNSPNTHIVDSSENYTYYSDGQWLVDSCAQISTCNECSYKGECGFCYDKDDASGSGSCVRHGFTDKPDSEGDETAWAFYGRCSRPDKSGGPFNIVFNDSNAAWNYGYCPTTLSWLPILGMILYLCSFSIGFGPMPWAINAELYPNWARSTGTSLSTAVNWAFNLVIALTFLTLAKAITKEGAYFLYAAVTLLGLIWYYLVLPETKNKTIEEIQLSMMGPWFSCGKEPKGLYPGMPVGNGVGGRSGNSGGLGRQTKHSQNLFIPSSQSSAASSSNCMASGGSADSSGSPPRRQPVVVSGGVPGHVQHVLLQPRTRTDSEQSQISARSTFEVGPTSIRPELLRGRSAMSTSQLYMQQRRELAIKQQRKQEQQRRQQNADANGNSTDDQQQHRLSCSSSIASTTAAADEQRKRKISFGDHNNNRDSSNPFMKLLKRFGWGGSSGTTAGAGQHQRRFDSVSDSGIEPAVSALQHKPETPMLVAKQ